MPLVYGEGSRAFLRLQEEIMEESRDQSLFAWQSAEREAECTGVLLASLVLHSESLDRFLLK
jgi:hypothetical protein